MNVQGRKPNKTPKRIFVPKYIGIGEHNQPVIRIPFNDDNGNRKTVDLILDVVNDALEVSVCEREIRGTKFRNKSKKAERTPAQAIQV